jgi:tRNA pseudouridine65 synthase
MTIPILYEDEHILVVDKPRDIHVHPTSLSRGEQSVQTILEAQGAGRLFPAHRLDRPVGGVLLMARDPQTASVLGLALRNRDNLEKLYLCVVRGWMEGSGVIDRPMRQEPGKPEREASTRWKGAVRTEAPWSDGTFPTSRYSLLECEPESGRYHQIRRHLSGIGHPILGDVAHGDNPRNRIWLRETGLDGLLLRAHRLSLTHPRTGERITVTAPPDPRFVEASRLFGWEFKLVGA